MEIIPGNPVDNQIQGLKAAPKTNKVDREKREPQGQQAARPEEGPDYRISLSDASKNGIAEMADTQRPGQGSDGAPLTEEAAARMAQQVSEQLAQTNAAISNQVIQKAVDLFT